MNNLNVYSIPEVSTAIDESLPAVFAKLGYKQQYKLIDLKLILGYSISLVAGTSFILDRKFKWHDVLGYQYLLVGLYCVISIAYWIFTKYFEKGIKYQGTKINGKHKEVLNVKTAFKNKYDPVCTVVISKGNSGQNINAKLDITKIFNEYGVLQFAVLVKWFEEQVAKLGEAKKLE